MAFIGKQHLITLDHSLQQIQGQKTFYLKGINSIFKSIFKEIIFVATTVECRSIPLPTQNLMSVHVSIHLWTMDFRKAHIL